MRGKKVLYFFLTVIIILIAMEGILRWMGYQTYPKIEKQESSVPGNYEGFNAAHGFYLIPGQFHITVNRLKFTVTHNPDSNRITRLAQDTINYNIKPRINIYGCSFTWGAGLNDTSTYPFLIQTALPSYNVINKGVSGAGNLHAYLDLKEQIRKNQVPEIAIISYASFHEQRNTWNREWSTLIKQFIINKSDAYAKNDIVKEKMNDINAIQFPQARMEQDSLVVLYQSMNGDLFPFSKSSVLCNRVNSILQNWNEKIINSNLVTRKLFYEMQKLCKEHKIRLIVACIDTDDATYAMQRYLKQIGLETIDLGVNYQDHRYNLYPDDLHPNAAANKIYASKIIEYLKKEQK